MKNKQKEHTKRKEKKRKYLYLLNTHQSYVHVCKNIFQEGRRRKKLCVFIDVLFNPPATHNAHKQITLLCQSFQWWMLKFNHLSHACLCFTHSYECNYDQKLHVLHFYESSFMHVLPKCDLHSSTVAEQSHRSLMEDWRCKACWNWLSHFPHLT